MGQGEWIGQRLRQAITARFSLQADQAADSQIDEALRAGVELRGATPWILMFAIFIASIGLNVNATAVIIGAMLISPLMGPIMGMGYGFGIYDFALIRKSLQNLGVATLISLLTSTVYFLLTPLTGAQSELLARTSPTIWDVLIALFGGLAGIVASTRKEKTNVIPGVAIATALMPPLCTAGYGLATANLKYFLGAFYLFSINSVFIALGTVIVIRYLHLPHRKFVDPRTERRVKRWLLLIALLTALPSCYLAYRLVGEELFRNAARVFIKQEFQFDKTHVVTTTITPSRRSIEVSLIGEPLSPAMIAQLKAKLVSRGFAEARLVILQGNGPQLNVEELKENILTELYQANQRALSAKEAEIRHLQQQLAEQNYLSRQAADIVHELQAQYPELREVVIGQGWQPGAETGNESLILLQAISPTALAADDLQRIRNWLQVRSKTRQVRVDISVRR